MVLTGIFTQPSASFISSSQYLQMAMGIGPFYSPFVVPLLSFGISEPLLKVMRPVWA